MLSPELLVTAGTYAVGFLVNNWAFAGSGSSGDPNFPYLNVPDPAFALTNYIDPNTNSYRWIGTPEVTDQTGVGGQNSTNPQSLFGNHQIVKVITKDGSGNDVTTFYDPSYGLTYTSLSNMEATVIDGYIHITTALVGGTTYNYAYAIRMNDLGGHLVASYDTY